jgi:type I restriction enzyme R subunit
MIEKETDFHLLYDLKGKLDDYQIYWESEVDAFSKAFFISSKQQQKEDLGKLHRYVDPAVDKDTRR